MILLSLYGLAACSQKLDNVNTSLEYYQKSIENINKFPNNEFQNKSIGSKYMARSNYFMGNVYRELEREEKAVKFHEDSYNVNF